MSCPCSFVPCDSEGESELFDDGHKRWNAILSKMIYAFEAIAAEEMDDENLNTLKFVDEGLDLFREYYFSLWD